MKDKVFIDTNILIYAYSEEDLKREIALNLIKENNSVISIQVIDEFVNVIRKKFKKDNKEILEALEEIESSFSIWGSFNIALVRKAISLSEKYNYSHYDCMIIAAALGAQCSILYSEDMQHNQSIEHKLRIINPFKVLPLVSEEPLQPVLNSQTDIEGH